MSGTNGGKSGLLKTRRRRGSYLGVTGKYPSLKNPHCLFAESLRERDLFAMANFDPSILRVDDHTPTIEYRDGSRKRIYTPDATIYRVDPALPSEIIEVKMSDQLERKEATLAPAFAAAREYATSNGKVFRILTEAELPRPLVKNLRFLFPYRKRSGDERIEEAILQSLREPKPLTAICRELQGKGLEASAVIARAWRLVALQRVSAQLHSVLTPSSMLEHLAWHITV